MYMWLAKADLPRRHRVHGSSRYGEYRKQHAPYHNAEHTMMVTLVGQEILGNKPIRPSVEDLIVILRWSSPLLDPARYAAAVVA
jgi:hypothetical protein